MIVDRNSALEGHASFTCNYCGIQLLKLDALGSSVALALHMA